jgi:hypothetical protein
MVEMLKEVKEKEDQKNQYEEEIAGQKNVSDTVKSEKAQENLEMKKVADEIDYDIEMVLKLAKGQTKLDKSPNVSEMEAVKELLKTETRNLLCLESHCTSSDCAKRRKELEEETEHQTKEMERLRNEIEKLGEVLKEETKVEKSPCLERNVSEMEAETKRLKAEIENLLSSDNPRTSSDCAKRCKEREEDKVTYTAEIERLKKEIEKLDKKKSKKEKLKERNQDKIELKDLMEHMNQKGHEAKKLKDDVGKFL